MLFFQNGERLLVALAPACLPQRDERDIVQNVPEAGQAVQASPRDVQSVSVRRYSVRFVVRFPQPVLVLEGWVPTVVERESL